MRVNPYDTMICQHYKSAAITQSLHRVKITDPYPVLTTPMGNVVRNACFVPPKSNYDDIAGFTQCVDIGTTQDPLWVLDARPYMRWDRREDSYRLVAENDFAFQCVRLALTQVAQTGDRAAFYRLGDLPGKAFIRWLGQALSQRFNLSLEHQIRVAVIIGFYYYTQMSKSLHLEGEKLILRAKHVARLTGVLPSVALELGEQLGNLATGTDLAQQLAAHSGSVRLQGLKFTDLYTIVSASWIGVHARENVGVALEHIPTWVAMVYASLDEKSYRKTIISQRAANAMPRQADVNNFTTAVYQLVSTRFE